MNRRIKNLRQIAKSTTVGLIAALTAVSLLSAVTYAVAQESTSIFDSEPYDLVTLKQGGQQFKLVPLEMATRLPLRPADANSTLLVRLLKRPEQQYQIQWADVEKVQLFEELVLAEAATLVDQKSFDDAYECYEFVKRRAPSFPGLVEASRSCMFREAEYWQQLGQYQHVLSLLNELYEQDARFPGLKQALGVAVDRLVEQYFSAEQNAAARVLLAELDSKFPGHEVVENRRQQLMERAQRLLQSARTARESHAMREAHNAAEEALAVWPELTSARDLLTELHHEYPIVEVGVRHLPQREASGFTLDWGRRRQQRLRVRSLFEPIRFTEDGGEYQSPLGSFELLEGTVQFEIDSKARWSPGGQPLNGAEVAQGILAAWNGQELDVPFVWRPLLDRVESVEGGALNVLWRDVPPKWQALLQLSPIHLNRVTAGLAPYQLAEQTAGMARFIADGPESGEASAAPTMPREVIERRFGSTASAIEALRRKQIQIYDRLPPWELPNVRRYDELMIGRYAAPTVHFLVANPDSEWLSQALFRRGLVHALHRTEILKQLLGPDAASTGNVLSGPFPHGHAVNDAIAPRAWDPRLAIALWQHAGASGRSAENPLELKLVYPPTETARRASRAIQQQLQLNEMGINLQLQERADIELDRGTKGDWDLRYVEWPALEPIVDAARLLGRGGLAQLAHPAVDRALRRLASSTTFDEAVIALHEIHQLVHTETLVIPLWQLDEFFVYHESLEAVGSRPTTLYQSIELWKVNLAQ